MFVDSLGYWLPVLQLATASSGDKAFLDYPSCDLIQNAPFSELRFESGDFVAPCRWEMLFHYNIGFTT